MKPTITPSSRLGDDATVFAELLYVLPDLRNAGGWRRAGGGVTGDQITAMKNENQPGEILEPDLRSAITASGPRTASEK